MATGRKCDAVKTTQGTNAMYIGYQTHALHAVMMSVCHVDWLTLVSVIRMYYQEFCKSFLVENATHNLVITF